MSTDVDMLDALPLSAFDAAPASSSSASSSSAAAAASINLGASFASSSTPPRRNRSSASFAGSDTDERGSPPPLTASPSSSGSAIRRLWHSVSRASQLSDDDDNDDDDNDDVDGGSDSSRRRWSGSLRHSAPQPQARTAAAVGRSANSTPRRLPKEEPRWSQHEALLSSSSALPSSSSASALPFDYTQLLVLPYVLAGWLQLLFNVALGSCILYGVYLLVATVRADVLLKVDSYRAGIVAEIDDCAQRYAANRCLPVSERLPAVHALCSGWELCMQRDPSAVGRARVSAETFAEIVNSFIEPISYKTMFFFFLTAVALTVCTNVAFSLMRRLGQPGEATGGVVPHHAHLGSVSAPPASPALPSTHALVPLESWRRR